MIPPNAYTRAVEREGVCEVKPITSVATGCSTLRFRSALEVVAVGKRTPLDVVGVTRVVLSPETIESAEIWFCLSSPYALEGAGAQNPDFQSVPGRDCTETTR